MLYGSEVPGFAPCLTIWYALWVPKYVGSVTSFELSVSVIALPSDPCSVKDKVPGSSFSLYLALSIDRA